MADEFVRELAGAGRMMMQRFSARGAEMAAGADQATGAVDLQWQSGCSGSLKRRCQSDSP
jgi:hypothetical protein